MRDKLIPKSEHVYELPQEGNMRVPGRIYSSQSLLEHPGMDSAIQQVANVATLPGIVNYSMAMVIPALNCAIPIEVPTIVIQILICIVWIKRI